jgi:hypothetical protein
MNSISYNSGFEDIPYGFIGKFDYSNVEITKHVYDQLLLRMGWNKVQSEYKLRTLDFYQFNRFSPIVEMYPDLINKFNNKPKSRYYVNEDENIILVEVTDKDDKKTNKVVTCLFLESYLKTRYSKYYQTS